MFEPKLGFVLLFVKNPVESTAFYNRIFNIKPLEQSATFALFALSNHVMLGFWSRKTAEPRVSAEAGGCEIAFSEDNVDALYDQWLRLGVPMAQVPTHMSFGRTFVALDPDGHRIRIYETREET